MPAESVDPNLDPPFNSNANYKCCMAPSAAVRRKRNRVRSDDTWKWGKDAQRAPSTIPPIGIWKQAVR
jgi:hypothetical protein